MATTARKQKVESILRSRQSSLHIVLENIHDPHNVSAIYRTCDAAGIPAVSLIYYYEKFPKVGKKSSASAYKWIETSKYRSNAECYDALRAKGFKVYATALTEKSVSLYDVDFTKPVALVLGNEHRGVSEDAAKYADETILIPQFGMVQSLNVSVAAAVCIFEALRQRLKQNVLPQEMSDAEIEEKLIKFLGNGNLK